jgi:UDP-glucose 4-epimerase
MSVLITGGSGFIGVHVCIELLCSGYEVVMIDNFINSKPEALRRIREISGQDFKFYEMDLLDKPRLEEVFRENNITAVIHLAGLKAVGESVESPLKYYRNNIVGSLILLETMNAFRVKRIVFSSSATVYGNQTQVPISEDSALEANNPYGRTKLIVEDILRDLRASDNDWSVVLLRYFNPIGAHQSGRIGEDPNGTPNNLTPYITQVAVGRLKEIKVFGNNYPTPDGTGVRDYIHVVDLAVGHVKALQKVLRDTGLEAYNLGTGCGHSVLEMIKTFEKVTGQKIPFKFEERRPGDSAICFADPHKAEEELGWVAKFGVEEMCRDAWRWQSNNPFGYDDVG